jgi:hypothetical protein
MSEIKCEIIKKTGMLSKSDLPRTLSKCRGDGILFVTKKTIVESLGNGYHKVV